ncbi:hypothetical protein NDU88_005301 [Pleurodeles waltl]|uniref:Uncharacterized protein n=1 Tax=Pleurodeles waltl TaxID=8319 RepID=A0AAV7SLD8_PLEWA|nr:hypothetical protein NDU88_005301 [Pleurodeles waltl]
MITGRKLAITPAVALLGSFPRPHSKKVTNKFIDLALILARREITMHWKDPRGPRALTWKDTLTKWAEAEGEALRLEPTKGAGSAEGVPQWDSILDRLKNLTTDSQEQDTTSEKSDSAENNNTNSLRD